MRNGTRLQSTGPGPARVLLIGDVQKALLEYRDMDRGVFEICDNVLDGSTRPPGTSSRRWLSRWKGF